MITLKCGSLLVAASIVMSACCFASQEWPFIEHENNSWDIASPRVSFDDVTEDQLRRAKEIGESSWYSDLHSNKLSVAIEHIAAAWLYSIAGESHTIVVEEQGIVAYYAGEWSDQGVCVGKFAGQHTNHFWTVKPAAGVLPPRVTGFIKVALSTGVFSNTNRQTRSIYLAGVKYFPFLRLQTRKGGDPIPGAKDVWLKASVYITDDGLIVCEVEVVDWNQNVGIRNVGMLAFHYDGGEITWVASSGPQQKSEFDKIPIYRDYCIDKNQNVRIYIACNGCEGRVILEKGIIDGLFKVLESTKR